MTTNIILAGVGGQGVLSIATILDIACLNNNMFFKQSEVHGMSQRGGAVYSHVRISDGVIYSDLIPKGQADIIISTEPMESLRYLPYLKKDGYIISESAIYDNIADYPEYQLIEKEIKNYPNHLIVDAKDIAKKEGNARAANIVLLGAMANYIPLKERALKAAIKTLFEAKGERIINLNLQAFEAGKNMVAEPV